MTAGAKQAGVRVALVDDDPELLSGLATLLDRFPELCVVGQCPGGEDLLRLLEREQVDVVLLDYSMPRMGGTEVARAVSSRFPQVKIIMLTAFAYPESLGEALLEGVQGFLTKDLPIRYVVQAVQAVARGGRAMAPAATDRLLSSYRDTALKEREKRAFQEVADSLSGLRRSVLAGITQGMTNRAIARRWNISEGTVRTYSTAVLSAFGCRSRTELAIKAARVGYQPTETA